MTQDDLNYMIEQAMKAGERPPFTLTVSKPLGFIPPPEVRVVVMAYKVDEHHSILEGSQRHQ